MAYSDSFPATRPVFQADFANGGRVDPRISYSRSTTGSFYGKNKHLSSENLLANSNPNSSWTEGGVSITTNAASSPDGTTTGSSIIEDSSTGVHRAITSFLATNGSTYTFSAYLKANGRSIVFVSLNTSANGSVEFDLSGSGTATNRSGSPSNLSISQIGSTGWYKCSFQVTAAATGTVYANLYLCDAANSTSYAGDGTSGVYGWGIQASSTGETVLNETSGQIHREYAPTLQTAAINAPRFEHSASDSASEAIGSSRGLLIEGSSTNLIAYSDDLTNAWWDSGTGVNKDSNVAVGPDGTPTADMLRLDSSTGGHYIRRNAVTVAASTSHTLSTYVKPVGNVKCKLTAFENGGDYTSEISIIFDLSGSGSVQQAIIGSGTITALSNGWFRITATGTTDSTSSSVQIAVMDNTGGGSFAGDGYSGLLLAKLQYEASSFASSPITTSGSQVTRASDSASMDLTQAGYTGGPFTVVSETEGSQGFYPRAFSISDGTGTNRLSVFRNSSTATTSTGFTFFEFADGVGHASSGVANSSTSNVKLAFSVDTDDLSWVSNEGTVATDTSVVLPKVDTLYIGANSTGLDGFLNGYCKRIAVFGEALSDTNLQALTS